MAQKRTASGGVRRGDSGWVWGVLNSVKLFANWYATSLRQGEQTRLRRPHESSGKRRGLPSPVNVHFDGPKMDEKGLAWQKMA